jgi:hydrogenase expression/formation protein HypC
MCIAVPGNIKRITGDDPLTRIGKVDFGGLLREINLALVPEVGVNDWVLVHAGFAIGVIDEQEAQKVFDDLRSITESGADDRGENEVR